MSPTGLDRSLLDDDAARAVHRLQSHGYEAYLVGGCVRDLLLGHRPKDFDIATSARPAAVKRTFPRNCRIIGRRFKLAHLHFQGNTKILEVSTFRRAPEQSEQEDEDLLITRDNEFGTAEEDAVRRDFTINALFYDPIADELIDHTCGLADLERRTVRTIGDPLVRFREDPVRILRAIKFAGRLGLEIDPDTADAMRRVAPDLVRAAPPRVLEEVLRLLRGGHALDAFLRMRDFGALDAILPTVQAYLDDADHAERVLFWRGLEALDGRAALAAAEGRKITWPPQNGILLGCLFHRPVQDAARRSPSRSPTGLAEELVSRFATDYRLPRRDTGCLKRICAVQHRFRDDPDHQRFRTEAFLRDPYFAEAIELFALSCVAEGIDDDLLRSWERRARRHLGRREDEFAEERAEPTRDRRGARDADEEQLPSGRRKKRRKRKPRGGEEHAESERARKPDRKLEGKRPEKKQKKNRERPRAEDRVETLEPEALDLSAFDVELDPKRVPTFGTIVEGGPARKKRRMPKADDDYRPPPPPGSEPDQPSPPPPDTTSNPNTFGDW